MSIEDQLRNVRPALDRAIGDAALVDREPATRASRPRVAILAFAVAAAIAATVGVIARLDNGGHHGVVTGNTSASTSVAVSSTTVEPSTTTTSTVATTTTGPSVALSSVDWPSVVYPMQPDCGTVFHPPVVVLHVEYAQPASGAHIAIVMVRCNAGAGSPPFAAYVYDGATSTTAPHLASTLVTDTDGWRANTFTASGSTVAIPVSGYSSASIAHCCPDVFATLRWSWNGSAYQLQGSEPAHVRSTGSGGY